MSIRTDVPPRWSDQTGEGSNAANDAVTRAIESRFGVSQQGQAANSNAASTAASASAFAQQGSGRGRVQAQASVHASQSSMSTNEVLEPHTLPPGSAPNEQATAMQDFCGSADANWGPVIGAHLSPCFIHAFLFGLVDLVFVVSACLRLRAILSLPSPPPRALSRNHILRITGSSLVAVYNLVMFAAHLAYDYGAPYQWLMYPVSCLSWSVSVLLLVVEARYAAPTTWLSKTFWLSSFFVASLLLWTSLADDKLRASHDLAPFLLHYCLYAAMAGMAVLLKEDAEDYAALAFDISEMSLDDDATADTPHDEIQPLAKGARTRWGAGGEGRAELGRVVRVLGEEQGLGLAAVGCCLVGAPIEMVQFVYAGMVVDECAVPEGPSALPDYMAVLVALYLIQGVAAASQLILCSMVGERLALKLRSAAFQAILNKDVLAVEGGRGGELVGVLEGDVERLQEACTRQLCQVVQSGIQGLVGLALLLLLSWKLTLVALALLPVVALLMLVQTTVLQSYSRRSLEALSGLAALASEVLGAWATVRSFAKEGREKVRFGQQALASYSMCWRMGVAHGLADGVGVLVLKLCLVLAVFYGGSLVHHNELSGGVLVSFAFIALQVVMAVSVLPPALSEVASAVQRAAALLDLADARPDPAAHSGLTLPRCEGRLELRAVSLSFSAQPQPHLPALADVSFTVPPGQHAAIFGPPGAGKSALLSLVPRLVEGHEGLVLLDDTDVSTYHPRWLRLQIALVPQDAVVLSGSIADNIAMGQQVPRASVEAAAARAGLSAASLPEGLDTVVGLGGGGLAGVVKRQVAVARALLKDAPILLLDDPTEALAGPDAAQVEAGLAEAMEGRTTLSVSRAPRSFQGAASLVGVLSRGRLVEFGPERELRGGSGAYSQLLQQSTLPDTEADGPGEQGRWEGVDGGGGGGSRSAGLLAGLQRQLAGVEEGPALAQLRETIARYNRTLN